MDQLQQGAPRLGAQPEVSNIVGLSKSEIHRKVKAGTFPAPVRLGRRCTRWNIAEVENWIRDRLGERDKQKAA